MGVLHPRLKLLQGDGLVATCDLLVEGIAVLQCAGGGHAHKPAAGTRVALAAGVVGFAHASGTAGWAAGTSCSARGYGSCTLGPLGSVAVRILALIVAAIVTVAAEDIAGTVATATEVGLALAAHRGRLMRQAGEDGCHDDEEGRDANHRCFGKNW